MGAASSSSIFNLAFDSPVQGSSYNGEYIWQVSIAFCQYFCN